MAIKIVFAKFCRILKVAHTIVTYYKYIKTKKSCRTFGGFDFGGKMGIFCYISGLFTPNYPKLIIIFSQNHLIILYWPRGFCKGIILRGSMPETEIVLMTPHSDALCGKK